MTQPKRVVETEIARWQIISLLNELGRVITEHPYGYVLDSVLIEIERLRELLESYDSEDREGE